MLGTLWDKVWDRQSWPCAPCNAVGEILTLKTTTITKNQKHRGNEEERGVGKRCG